jgi:hypothetical protein
MEKYRSKLGLSTLLITSAGLMLALSSFAPAFATPPTSGSGILTTTSITITSTTFDGPNTIYTGSLTLADVGVFAGTYSATFHEVLYADGTFTYQNTGTFTGTLGSSLPGTSSCVVTATGAGAFESGQFVCGQGTDGLTGAHAQGTFAGTAPTYPISVQYHFDP